MAYTISATTKGGRNGRAVLETAAALAMGAAEGSAATAKATIRAAFRARLVVLLRPGDSGARQEARSRRPGRATSPARSRSTRTRSASRCKAELKVTIPGADKAKVQALVEDAHKICPYSQRDARQRARHA